MGAYATETPQVSARFLNQSFLNAIEGGRTKEAADEGTNFIREIVRQASAVREILPPVGLQDDEIDRDERTEEPKKIVEKEPQSVATFVEFQGTPSAYWFRGPRYAVFFGKILSPKATKSNELLFGSTKRPEAKTAPSEPGPWPGQLRLPSVRWATLPKPFAICGQRGWWRRATRKSSTISPDC